MPKGNKKKKGEKKPKVVIIGGGTGTYTLLTGLKKYPLSISAIVSMMDSGGSNRILRDELGLLPTSDIRQCILALTQKKDTDLVRKLFTYRFNKGKRFFGMTFGNLFMAALADIYKDQKKAIEKTCEFFEIKGDIIPVTYQDCHLGAIYENKKRVIGEHLIDEPPERQAKYKIVKLFLDPPPKANRKAIKAIKEADFIVLGPGDLYTSLLPNLLVRGVKKAIKKTKAKIIFVMNLMTKWGQTNNFKASDFIKEIEKYIQRLPNYIIINKGAIPKRAIQWYKKTKAVPVENDLQKKQPFAIISANLVARKTYQKAKGDILTRSLIRHDSKKLGKIVYRIIRKRNVS